VVSGAGTEPSGSATGRDPVVRLLIGCAIVLAVVVVLAVCVVVAVGWQLTRDETPGRPVESFVTGDESRYWRVDLRAEDAGLQALFARLDEINVSARRDVLRGTPLEGFPLPHRRARLDELAPFSVELSLFSGDAAPGWAARMTYPRGVLRVRAAMKFVRWVMGRNTAKSETTEVDGIAVTAVHDNAVSFAFAGVGDRVIAGNDTARVGRVLHPAAGAATPRAEQIAALHERIKLDGEDAWGFLADGGGAVGSFDVNDRDELVFKVAMESGGTVEEDVRLRGTRETALGIVTSFLPGLPAEAIELDGDGAAAIAPGVSGFSGRVPHLSERLESAVKSLLPRVRVERTREPETPSASPTPTSPPRR